MTDPIPTLPNKKIISAVPYAVCVPVLVVMAQSAWGVVSGRGFRNHALLSDPFHPVVLGGMAIIAVISYFAIRPFTGRVESRWTVFLACILGFTILVGSLLPNLAE